MPSKLVNTVNSCTTFTEIDNLLIKADETEAKDIFSALKTNPELLKRLVRSLSDYKELIDLLNRSSYYKLRSEILGALNQHPKHLLRLCAPSLAVVKQSHEDLRDNYPTLIQAIVDSPNVLYTITPTLTDFMQLRSMDWSQLEILDSCLLSTPGVFEHYVTSTKDFCDAVETLDELQTQLWQKLMENPGRIVKDANDKLLLLPITPDSYRDGIKKLTIKQTSIVIDSTPQQAVKADTVKEPAVEPTQHHGHRKHRSSYAHPELVRKSKKDPQAETNNEPKKEKQSRHVRHSKQDTRIEQTQQIVISSDSVCNIKPKA